MSVEVKNNSDKVKNEVETGIGFAIRMMLEDIYVAATPYTPKDTSDLRKKVLRVMDGDNKGIITWDTSYAGVQEQGYRKDKNGKRIYFKNYTTFNTGPHYAFDAVEDVVTKLPEYLEKAKLL